MKQKELSRWMKAIVVLGFICVLFLDAVWVPELGKDLAGNTPELQRMFWPCLIYFWISTIPVMVFMALVWKMATEIGRDNSFCMKNALRLRTCSLLAAADTLYYIIGGVVLLVLTQAWRIPVALNAAVALGTLEISVVGTALAFTLYLQGVSDVGGVRASLLACTEPVSAALCAALWLHTSFAWQDLLGFAAILVMAVLIALPERASEKSTEKAEN